MSFSKQVALRYNVTMVKTSSISPQSVSPTLLHYIDTKIFPLYQKNEPGHGISHIKYVIRRSFQFTQSVPNLNPDIIYTVAAYHDLGHHIDYKHHEVVSAQIVRDDRNLPNFFSKSDIITIAEAVEDHRSDSQSEPRSIYGKIIVTADRNINIDAMLRCTYHYRLEHYPHFTLAEIIEDSRQHLRDKYGKQGYARDSSYFPDPESDRACVELDKLVSDPVAFTRRYCTINHLIPPTSPR